MYTIERKHGVPASKETLDLNLEQYWLWLAAISCTSSERDVQDVMYHRPTAVTRTRVLVACRVDVAGTCYSLQACKYFADFTVALIK
jgi:hypothetical protein